MKARRARSGASRIGLSPFGEVADYNDGLYLSPRLRPVHRCGHDFLGLIDEGGIGSLASDPILLTYLLGAEADRLESWAQLGREGRVPLEL